LDFIAIAFLIFGAYLTITNVLKWGPALAVNRDGISTSGTVLSFEDVEIYDGPISRNVQSHKYYVVYEYQVLG
jgi:hypothetical protein